LEADFSEEEFREAIFESYSNGAHKPNGFSFIFYQKFSPIVKMDLLALFKGFEKGCSNIARLNYVLITLIPKEEEARTLKKFRPISLINCNFKIFAKAMNIRLI
jgi:hypothetical protein